ncbi:AlpA family phage regulatory protein [Erwinia persicina]|uniref:AlpA family phage regulatory protein n=1 Tax=Erwinia persicina TaxID=55211 RepID=UPI003B974256
MFSRLALYLPQENTVTSHQLLRLKQVEEKTGLKRSQIYLYMKDGTFPAQSRLARPVSPGSNRKLTNGSILN